MANDVEIGRNVARIRGSMSQKDLADEMRKRGFRWSQATVWAVEKGERPLRLVEAEAVGEVLGIHHSALLYSAERLNLVYEFREFSELLEEIQELAYQSFERQRRLALEIDWNPDAFDEDDDALDVISRNAADAAIEGILRAEKNYRSLLEVSTFPEPASVVPSAGKYSSAFMGAVSSRLDDERERIRAIREKEESDGVDQTT